MMISVASRATDSKTITAADGITEYRLTMAEGPDAILDSGVQTVPDFIITGIMPGTYEVTAYGYASDGTRTVIAATSTESMTLERGGKYSIALDDPAEGMAGEIAIDATPPYSGTYLHDADTLTAEYLSGTHETIILSTADGTLIYEGDEDGLWHYRVAEDILPSGNAMMTLSVTSDDGETAERTAMAVLLPGLRHRADACDFDFRKGKDKLPAMELQPESIVGLQQYRLMNADDYPEDAKLAVIILTRQHDDITPAFQELSTPIAIPGAAIYAEAYVICSGYLDSDHAVLLDKTDMLEIPDPIVLSTDSVYDRGNAIVANRDEYLYIMYSNGLQDAELQFSFYEENGTRVWQDSPIHADSIPTADNPSVTSSAKVRIVDDGDVIAESNEVEATREYSTGIIISRTNGEIKAYSEVEGYDILIWPEHSQFENLQEGELFLPSYDADDLFV